MPKPKLVSYLDLETPEKRRLDTDRAYKKRFWETDPIHYQNQQWAVTDYGIENVTGPYHYYIEATALEMKMGSDGYGWPDHMAGKNWVDVDAFNDVWISAISHFGRGAA